VANRFIQKNPFQLEKRLSSHKQQKNKSVALINTNQIEKVLAKLNGYEKGYEVLLLGRNHYHKPELLLQWVERFQSLSIGFMTCHASKGREADYVIIMNVDEGQFPARVKALHLDSALSQNSDTFPYAEERRLFYVALTRAKKKVWLSYTGEGSSFIKELLEGGYPIIK
jgi:DNA helicase-4